MNSKIIFIGVILLILFIIAYIFYKISQSPLVVIYETSVDIDKWSNKEKEVLFVGMHHIGLDAFYKNVQKEVIKAKKAGYVLFYEYVDYTNEEDTTILRKTQKLAGFIPTPENYAKLAAEFNTDPIDEDKIIAQNNELFLTQVNSKNFNVDLTPKEIIDVYEKNYGTIKLTPQDLKIPLDRILENTLPNEHFETIILELRDKHLANVIDTSEYDKIMVLYGSAHKEGTLAELQKLGSNWKQVSSQTVD